MLLFASRQGELVYEVEAIFVLTKWASAWGSSYEVCVMPECPSSIGFVNTAAQQAW